MILDLIEKNKNITQREISESIGVAVSMVNYYLDEYEQKSLIKRKYISTKTVEYFVTKKGMERRKLLNINYLNASLKIFKSANKNIISFLNQIIQKGYKTIYLYGAGEVAEILLQSIMVDKSIPIKILGIIDDDLHKQKYVLLGTQIVSLDKALERSHDGILVSSYTHRDKILNKLYSIEYNKNKIIQFFD